MSVMLITLIALALVIVPVIYIRHRARKAALANDFTLVVITDVDLDVIHADFDDEPTESGVTASPSLIEFIEAPWPCNCGACRNCWRQHVRMTWAN